MYLKFLNATINKIKFAKNLKTNFEQTSIFFLKFKECLRKNSNYMLKDKYLKYCRQELICTWYCTYLLFRT